MAFTTTTTVKQTNDVLNYYLTINMNNICRICLEKGPKLMPIFDAIKPPHFSILIMACANVQVIQGDGLPPYICQRCISKLNIAFQFKTQCESSDLKLRQCFESFNQATSDLTHFMDLKKNDASYNQVNINQNHLQLSNQEDINNALQDAAAAEMKEEVNGLVIDADNNLTTPTAGSANAVEPQLTTLQNLEFDSQITEEEKSTFRDLKIDFGDLTKTDMELKIEDLNLVSMGQLGKKTKKSQKPHQCDTCGKVFRTKPGLIHHIRIHTGERPYICHLCDKRFINGGHLHTHMRTHTGEKNHVCSACSKAFATAQQLTKHTIAIHTSERPYACTYCSKRFASSSNLNTHTKIHTGEKNYHCDQCIKAFSTKGQLFQHILVHTGEKAFLCQYCEKRFSQKAHLIRHLKTHKS